MVGIVVVFAFLVLYVVDGLAEKYIAILTKREETRSREVFDRTQLEADRLRIEQRKLDLEEEKLERLHPKRTPENPPTPAIELPEELVDELPQHGEEWAHEGMVERARELYAEAKAAAPDAKQADIIARVRKLLEAETTIIAPSTS